MMTLGLSRPIGDLLTNSKDLKDGYEIHNIYGNGMNTCAKEKDINTRKTLFNVSPRSVASTSKKEVDSRNRINNRYKKIIL